MVDTTGFWETYDVALTPDTLHVLEAAADPDCRFGEWSIITAGCTSGDVDKVYTLFTNAPVIWSDPQGFTYVFIHIEDYVRFESWLKDIIVWASCNTNYSTDTKR